MSKEEWKEAGTNLGHAWKDFGKTVIRSADRVVEKAKNDPQADNTVTTENGETIVEPNENKQEEPNSTVFSDGSWKSTMKGLGKAFAGIGKSTLNTVSDACDSVTGEKKGE